MRLEKCRWTSLRRRPLPLPSTRPQRLAHPRLWRTTKGTLFEVARHWTAAWTTASSQCFRWRTTLFTRADRPAPATLQQSLRGRCRLKNGYGHRPTPNVWGTDAHPGLGQGPTPLSGARTDAPIWVTDLRPCPGHGPTRLSGAWYRARVCCAVLTGSHCLCFRFRRSWIWTLSCPRKRKATESFSVGPLSRRPSATCASATGSLRCGASNSRCT